MSMYRVPGGISDRPCWSSRPIVGLWEVWTGQKQVSRWRETQVERDSVVGRTPWSAADAPVGLFGPCVMLICAINGGTPRADQGVRPTPPLLRKSGKLN